jgi:ABC-type glycerol-3-phosphate transport system substrate-binding protein
MGSTRKTSGTAASADTSLDRRAFLTRAAALGAIVPLGGGLLAACGSDDKAGSGFSTPAPTTPSASSGPAKLTGKVVIATNGNPPSPAQKALAAAYQKEQPGVSLVWQTKDWGGPGAYQSYLGTQLAAGDIKLDIVSGNYVPTFGKYVNFDEDRATVNPYTKNAWSEDLDFDFYRQVNAAGQQIMLATQSVHIFWFYNEDLMARANVKAPTNWTEFVEVCSKLKNAGITPVAANFGYEMPQWMAEIYFDQYHADWVKTVQAQKGDWNYNPGVDGKFTFKPNDPNLHSSYTYSVQRFYKGMKDGKLRFDTDRVADLVTNFAKIFPTYATGDFFVLEDNYAPFLQQQAAMMINGSWSLPSLNQDLASLTPARLKELKIKAGSIKPFKWGTFENPPMQGNLIQSKVRSVESAAGEYISIVNKDAKTTALVKDFTMFWLSKAGYQPYMDAYVKAGNWAPAGPVQIKGLDLPKANAVFDDMKFLGNAECNYNGFWTGGATPAQTTDLHNMLKNVLQGKVTPKKYASDLQAYTMDNLDASLKAASLSKSDIENPARRPSGA